MATQQELANLAKLYLAARNRLLNTIVNFRGVGTKVYANSVLQCLNRELEALAKAADEFIDTAIPAEYEKGLRETYDYFKKNNLLMKHPSLFADLHAEAVHTVAREMQYQIRQGLASVGRQILRYVDSSRDEALRAVGLASSGEKIASGSTVVQMKNLMIEKLKNEGFMTVQYSSGARAFQVPLDVYAMLCARSTTREAGNLARENQLTANGYDLVEISTHYPTCEVCAQYQGRVYSISGNDKRFPPLSRAFSSGYHNIHPNCRHVLVPFVESMQTPEEMQQAIERSNRPFKDSRAKREVDLYNKQQAQNRRMREDLYQYERYKARLGPDAPKRFHGFRKIKKAGGEKWALMQLDYRRRTDLAQHPEKALPNADKAIAAEAKFTRYLFNPENADGWAKGVALSSRLGYDKDNWQELQAEALKRAPLYPVSHVKTDQHGTRWEQKMVLYGKKGNPANVVVGWITDDVGTRMTTLYIKEVR